MDWIERLLTEAFTAATGWPAPTEPLPNAADLEYMADGTAEATDGCLVEPDGLCDHGHASWLLYLGMI